MHWDDSRVGGLITAAIMAIVSFHSTPPAEAGGFQVTSLCGKCQGRRNAGEAAAADTAATVFFNPAGLTYLNEKKHLDGSINSIVPWTDYRDRGSTNPFGGPLLGDGRADGAVVANVPNLYYSHPVTKDLVLGLGVNLPYGLATKYDKAWIGRYHSTHAELTAININPGLGYKVTPQFSVGVGLNAAYVDTTLKNAVDFGSTPFFNKPNTFALDGESKLEGNDWGYGWNAGLLYETEAGTRLGLSYRSSIKTTIQGHSRLTVPSAVTVGSGGFYRSSKIGAKSDVELPATVRLGIYQPLRNADWAILAGATWTDWSSFDESRVKFDNGNPDLVQPQNWEDNWRVSLGVEYRATPRLGLRGGLEYDRTPIRGDAVKTPRIPGNNLTWLTVGLSYAIVEESLDLDLSYSYVHAGKHDIRDTEVQTPYVSGGTVGGNTLDGKYDSGAHIFGAGLRWRF